MSTGQSTDDYIISHLGLLKMSCGCDSIRLRSVCGYEDNLSYRRIVQLPNYIDALVLSIWVFCSCECGQN